MKIITFIFIYTLKNVSSNFIIQKTKDKFKRFKSQQTNNKERNNKESNNKERNNKERNNKVSF